MGEDTGDDDGDIDNNKLIMPTGSSMITVTSPVSSKNEDGQSLNEYSGHRATLESDAVLQEVLHGKNPNT